MLWPFNKYPGTDYETYNWEWIISTVKRLQITVDTWVNDIKDYVLEILSDHPEWIQNWMLDDGTVTTEKIADHAVTIEKMADYNSGIKYNTYRYVSGNNPTFYYITEIPKTAPDGSTNVIKQRYGEAVQVHDFAEGDNIIAAFNAGTFDLDTYISDGPFIINNGVVTVTGGSADSMIGIKEDGTLAIYDTTYTTSDQMLADGVVNACAGLLPLIINGQDVATDDDVTEIYYQRQVIGQKANGDIILLTCDGKSRYFDTSYGLTVTQILDILHGYNVVTAYMLDSGGSTVTTIQDVTINRPTDWDGYRKVPIIWYVEGVKKGDLAGYKNVVGEALATNNTLLMNATHTRDYSNELTNRNAGVNFIRLSCTATQNLATISTVFTVSDAISDSPVLFKLPDRWTYIQTLDLALLSDSLNQAARCQLEANTKNFVVLGTINPGTYRATFTFIHR